jgi:hypothetical protein
MLSGVLECSVVTLNSSLGVLVLNKCLIKSSNVKRVIINVNGPH